MISAGAGGHDSVHNRYLSTILSTVGNTRGMDHSSGFQGVCSSLGVGQGEIAMMGVVWS